MHLQLSLIQANTGLILVRRKRKWKLWYRRYRVGFVSIGLNLLCAVHNGPVTALPFSSLQVRWNPLISRGWWLRCCIRSQQWLPWVTWQTCPAMSTSRPPSPARTGGCRGSTASSDRAAPPAWPQIPSFFNFFFLLFSCCCTTLPAPNAPRHSVQLWSWAKLLQSTGLWRARVRSQRWLWRRSLTLWVGDKTRWVLTPFSWLWGEQSKPKYSSLPMKAHLWAVSRCLFITPAVEVGLSHEAPLCPSWGMCGTLNTLNSKNIYNCYQGEQRLGQTELVTVPVKVRQKVSCKIQILLQIMDPFHQCNSPSDKESPTWK